MKLLLVLYFPHQTRILQHDLLRCLLTIIQLIVLESE